MIWTISIAPDGAWVASADGQSEIVQPMYFNHADVIRKTFARAILTADPAATILETGEPEAIEVSGLLSALRAEGV